MPGDPLAMQSIEANSLGYPKIFNVFHSFPLALVEQRPISSAFTCRCGMGVMDLKSFEVDFRELEPSLVPYSYMESP